MSGSSVIKNHSCILKEVDGDKFASRIVFGLNSEVLQDFGLDFFRPVDIPPELEVKGEPHRLHIGMHCRRIGSHVTRL